ncbi:MAG TPA: glycosyltransferase [Candidatus Limnocylindrales bacterium]|nr:glycosyltransferase [Candidatus Limnocylindrales bacterium]
MNIVVISPTYNEIVNIEKLIPLLIEEIFPQVKNHNMQLLIVDDNSPDGTAAEVEKLMKKFKNVALLKGEKKGLGAAYARGMKYAMDKMKADAVMEFDADFQHDPKDIPRLIKAMDHGADLVIGSRYVPGGAIPPEWGFHRKLISRLGGLFAQIILLTFNVHDMTSGYKLTKSSFLKNVDLDHLYSKYYAYKLHILRDVMNQKAKVIEVPIIFYERKEGSSKITRKDLFDSLYVVIRLRIRDSARFIKFLIVGGTGFIVQLLMIDLFIRAGSEQFIASMIGGEAAILSNFFLNNIWTFKDTTSIKEHGGFLQRLIKFNLASLGSIGIQGAVTYIAVNRLGENLNIFGQSTHTAKIILFPTIIFLVIPLNYFVYNKIIWKTQKLKK